LAKNLRTNQTDAEKLLWKHLKSKQLSRYEISQTAGLIGKLHSDLLSTGYKSCKNAATDSEMGDLDPDGENTTIGTNKSGDAFALLYAEVIREFSGVPSDWGRLFYVAAHEVGHQFGLKDWIKVVDGKKVYDNDMGIMGGNLVLGAKFCEKIKIYCEPISLLGLSEKRRTKMKSVMVSLMLLITTFFMYAEVKSVSKTIGVQDLKWMTCSTMMFKSKTQL